MHKSFITQNQILKRVGREVTGIF